MRRRNINRFSRLHTKCVCVIEGLQDVDNLLISQPYDGEQALEIAEVLVRSGAVDVIVVDSVAALVPKAELDGEMGDAHMGLQARLMSQALRKLTAIVSRSKTCFIFKGKRWNYHFGGFGGLRGPMARTDCFQL